MVLPSYPLKNGGGCGFGMSGKYWVIRVSLEKNKQNELTVMEASQILEAGQRSVLNDIRSKEVSATKIGKNWRIRWNPHEFIKLGAIQARPSSQCVSL